ncbi:unnamed protein product [Zymoseptoria tritici ST99CH_1E4]|uniref:Apple domain-containing protein n=1 Tax=Zymoseptoria tritici ST99CH_1E4 TaxID=1276532 RepID=A0A2H1GF38_ZYMTR|nr:unnamed protein product [Zymoseptoria tritici ST99CH_1E4]
MHVPILEGFAGYAIGGLVPNQLPSIARSRMYTGAEAMGLGRHSTVRVSRTPKLLVPSVTSGITGLAAFNCTASGPDVVFSHNNATYATECFKQYLAGSASVTRPNVTIVNLGEREITSTIEDCLDKCDKFDEPGQPPCLAVMYYANLTVPIEKFGRNCFLKNDRGGYSEVQVEEVDLLHSMSAYRRCLDNDGCKGLL